MELRDHAENESVRNKSANDLLDRHPVLARRTHHEEERTIRISFGPAEIRQIFDARVLGEAS